MAKDRYVGVVPPIVTPVDKFERVDEAALRGIVRRCKDVGLHGVFVAGSNGECMALTQAERNRAIRIVLDEAGPDYPVMSGVMDSSTQRVIDNIKALEDMGGDVAVVTPVFYARHATQDETGPAFRGDPAPYEGQADDLQYPHVHWTESHAGDHHPHCGVGQ